jgi:hypothetical protein
MRAITQKTNIMIAYADVAAPLTPGRIASEPIESRSASWIE